METTARPTGLDPERVKHFTKLAAASRKKREADRLASIDREQGLRMAHDEHQKETHEAEHALRAACFQDFVSTCLTFDDPDAWVTVSRPWGVFRKWLASALVQIPFSDPRVCDCEEFDELMATESVTIIESLYDAGLRQDAVIRPAMTAKRYKGLSIVPLRSREAEAAERQRRYEEQRIDDGPVLLGGLDLSTPEEIAADKPRSCVVL